MTLRQRQKAEMEGKEVEVMVYEMEAKGRDGRRRSGGRGN